jgi:hypothetical protein
MMIVIDASGRGLHPSWSKITMEVAITITADILLPRPKSDCDRGYDVAVKGASVVVGGRWLGWPGGCSTTPGSRALSLLLEGDMEKPPCLVQLLVGLRV